MKYYMTISGADRETAISMLDRDLRAAFNTFGFYRVSSDKNLTRVEIPVSFNRLYSWELWKRHAFDRVSCNRLDAQLGFRAELA